MATKAEILAANLALFDRSARCYNFIKPPSQHITVEIPSFHVDLTVTITELGRSKEPAIIAQDAIEWEI